MFSIVFLRIGPTQDFLNVIITYETSNKAKNQKGYKTTLMQLIRTRFTIIP